MGAPFADGPFRTHGLHFILETWVTLLARTVGAGATVDGGRFNRPGVEALYLSRSVQTALEELRKGASIVSSATLVAYKITLADVADLSLGFDLGLILVHKAMVPR